MSEVTIPCSARSMSPFGSVARVSERLQVSSARARSGPPAPHSSCITAITSVFISRPGCAASCRTTCCLKHAPAISSTTQPKAFPVAAFASIGLPGASTRNGPRCTCAALAPTSFVNWAVFLTSSSIDSASSSLVTVGSSRLPSRPYESVLRTSEPEKPPCSLVTTTREQPAKARSSNLTCVPVQENSAMRNACGARKARLRWFESHPAVELDHGRKVDRRDDPVAVLAAAKDDAVGRLIRGQPAFDRLVHVDPDEELGVAAHPADHALLADQPVGEVHVVPAHASEPVLEDRMHVLHVRSMDRHLRCCLECERLALLLADARHAVALRCANLGAIDNEAPLVIRVHDLAHVSLGVHAGSELLCVAYEFAQPRPIDLLECVGEGHPAIRIDSDFKLDDLVPEQLGEQLGEVDVVRRRDCSIAHATWCKSFHPCVLGVSELLLNVGFRRRGWLSFGNLRLGEVDVVLMRDCSIAHASGRDPARDYLAKPIIMMVEARWPGR
eukprot:scaffold22030_cov66-Phaeocystis_antarctica.AAC.7